MATPSTFAVTVLVDCRMSIFCTGLSDEHRLVDLPRTIGLERNLISLKTPRSKKLSYPTQGTEIKSGQSAQWAFIEREYAIRGGFHPSTSREMRTCRYRTHCAWSTTRS